MNGWVPRLVSTATFRIRGTYMGKYERYPTSVAVPLRTYIHPSRGGEEAFGGAALTPLLSFSCSHFLPTPLPTCISTQCPMATPS